LIFEAKDAEGLAPFEDSRMWRLLLARLHPDAGGDHELFVFACAMRDEVSRVNSAATVSRGNARSTECPAAPFLRTWREAMCHWSTSNHEAVKNVS
jgi:hypothetical protein